MKRILSFAISAAMCFSLMSGCSSGDKADDNTLTITVPSDRYEAILSVMEEKFPEINFEVNYYVGDNASSYLGETIKHGDAGDLIYYTMFTTLSEETNQMLDLSGYPITGNINEDVLGLLDVNGAIYQIPGPLELRCIAYNKTLFEENGWKIPQNFDEQIEVIKQIRADQPDISPMVCSMFPAYAFVLPATYAQAGFLSSPAGYDWEQEYFAGTASYGVGMDEGFTAVERLIEADAFEVEEFVGKWNCNDAVINREAAMYIVWAGVGSFLDQIESSGCTDEYGLLPFYGQEDGESVIGYNASSLWSINRKLGEKGNEKKLENALKVMEWIVSAEGQELLKGNKGQIPVTKEGMDMDPRVEELMELGANGFRAPGLYAGYEHMMVESGQVIQDAILAHSAEGMRENAVKIADELNLEYVANKNTSGYTYLTEDIDKAETAQLMADILQESGMGDFTLITHTDLKNGVINAQGCGGNLYEGGITDIKMLIINANRNMHVSTIELTGAEVKTLLENGKGMYENEYKAIKGTGEPAEAPDSMPHEYFDYYWSGLEVAMKDGKVTSMKLNGTELSETDTYTVVFAENDYPRAYMDKAAVSETLVSEAMLDYFENHSEISAPEVLRK